MLVSVSRFLSVVALALTFMVSSSQATSVLFIGTNDDPDGGADAAVHTFLQDTFGAANVTYQNADATAAGDEAAYDALVISSTPGSGDMRGKYQNSTTGIVNWEEAIVDAGDGEFALSAGRPKETATHMINLNMAGHPIQGSLPNGVIAFTTGDAELFYSTGNAPGVGAIGHKDGDASMTFLTFADVGAPLLGDGSAGKPATAAGRRVTFPMTDSTFDLVTPEGQALLANAIDWVSVPEPSSFALTIIGLFAACGLAARRNSRKA